MNVALLISVLLFPLISHSMDIEVKGVVKEMGSRRLLSDTKIFFLPRKKLR